MPLVVCLSGALAWLSPSVPTASIARTVDDRPRIAIAPIAYSATIPDHTRMAVHATVTEAVKSFAQSALVLDVDAECQTRKCALRQARDADAEFLLELLLTVDERDYTIEMVVVAANDGRQLTESTGQCRLCAQAELLVEIAAQVASLDAALEREGPAPSPVIEQPMDDGPARFEPPPERRRARMEIGGWVSVALGLASAGAGSALLAIDGREHGPTCEVEDRDIYGACPNVYTTQLAGIISVGAGGVALATGSGLLIAGKARRKPGAAARLEPALGGVRLKF